MMFTSAVLVRVGRPKKLRRDEPYELVSTFLQSPEALEARKGQKMSSASTHIRAYSGNKHCQTWFAWCLCLERKILANLDV